LDDRPKSYDFGYGKLFNWLSSLSLPLAKLNSFFPVLDKLYE